MLKSAGQPPAGTARETNDPLGVALEGFVVHPRLEVVALEERQAPELEQVAVARLVLRQQSQMPTLLALRVFAEPVLHHVGFQPYDGFDSRVDTLLVELDGARKHAVVRDGERGHAELGRASHQVFHLARPVQRRVVRVDVQVAEATAGGPPGACGLVAFGKAIFHYWFGRR